MKFHDPDFALLCHLLPDRPLCLDVGANAGQSIRSIKAARPGAVIHSFEPNPEFTDVLQGVAAEFSDVTIHAMGLGARQDRLTFYIPSVNGVRFVQRTSMRKDSFDAPWLVTFFEEKGGAPTFETFVAPIMTGDALGFAPDLIKVDVEGAESEVIDGLCQTIDTNSPLLLIENGDATRLWPILKSLSYVAMMPNAERTGLVPFDGQRVNTFYVRQGRSAGSLRHPDARPVTPPMAPPAPVAGNAMSYIYSTIDQMCRHVDVADMHILEVGGDGQFLAGKELLRRGAASVTSTNIDGRQHTAPGDPRLSTRFADAHHLDQFLDDRFNLVFGIAVVEHILDVPSWLASTDKILKHGGMAFYHGDPLWSSSRGHHVWVEGAEGRNYRFNDPDCVVPNWGQLLYTPSQMRQILIRKGVPEVDADKICTWIYFSSKMNRYTKKRIELAAKSSPLQVIKLIFGGGAAPDAETETQLEAAVGDGSDYSINSAQFLLRKER